MNLEVIGVWTLLILWFSLVLLYYSVRQKKVTQVLLSACVTGVSLYLIQWIQMDGVITLPPVLVIAGCGLCTLGLIYGIRKEYLWQKNHLSERSVKYAVDALPAGICCYRENGRILLKNKAMEALHWGLTGKALLNGVSFEGVLFNDAPSDDRIVTFPDGKVYEFRKEVLESTTSGSATGGSATSGSATSGSAAGGSAAGTSKASAEYILIASEITEEYQKTQTLLEKQQTVTELNEKLRAYNNEILSVITAREVLNAKVKIHDELGASLLRVKKYLAAEDGADAVEEQAILESLRENLTFLQRELIPGEVDEYQLLLQTAKQLDVRISIEGLLPSEERVRKICVTALHECVTNTLRHAQGNHLLVSFQEDASRVRAVFRNNGEAPSGEIVEKGGLRSLRKLVEQEGGHMEIRTEEGFCLEILVSKRGTRYGL